MRFQTWLASPFAAVVAAGSLVAASAERSEVTQAAAVAQRVGAVQAAPARVYVFAPVTVEVARPDRAYEFAPVTIEASPVPPARAYQFEEVTVLGSARSVSPARVLLAAR